MARGDLLSIERAECLFLQVALPGRAPENAGVLLLDPANDRLYLRLRRDWASIAEEEDAEVLELLEDDLRSKAGEIGGAALLNYLEENASNLVRVTGREAIQLAGFEARLNRLYRENVRPRVLEFQTHLPLYSLRAAEFTIKRYTSAKDAAGDSWEHTRIRLEPLNPEFESWDLRPDEFTVVGEFVRVLPSED